ncbi:hypothetical protein [Streptococcus salivarius]
MKKNWILYLYYCFISLLFTLESIIYIGDPGDQFAFAQLAKKYSFIEFALFRYSTWSSRLLIESFTMFFSAHYLIFKLCLFLGMFLFFFSFNGLIFSRKMNSKIQYITPLLFWMSFPGIFFTSAGLIATMTNYLFPMITFVIACYLLKENSKWSRILSLPFIVFTCMQEQFTVFAFLLIVYVFIKKVFVERKKLPLNYIILGFVSAVGLLSGVLSPGSKIRVISEAKVWYPGFDKLSLFTKFAKGFLETNRVLFLTSELSVVFLVLLLLLSVSLIKKQLKSVFISVGLLYILIINKLGIGGILSSLSRLIDIQNSRNDILHFNVFENLFPLLFYTTILLALAFSVYTSFENHKVGLNAIVVLTVGYMSRMTVSLSPTIYASQLRTFTPLVFSFFIVSVLLVQEGTNYFYKSCKSEDILKIKI